MNHTICQKKERQREYLNTYCFNIDNNKQEGLDMNNTAWDWHKSLKKFFFKEEERSGQ